MKHGQVKKGQTAYYFGNSHPEWNGRKVIILHKFKSHHMTSIRFVFNNYEQECNSRYLNNVRKRPADVGKKYQFIGENKKKKIQVSKVRLQHRRSKNR